MHNLLLIKESPMTKIVSMINLKGGVGKTTTTIQLAECLVSEFKKKVLIIDLDPQTNATIALIGDEKWEKIDEQGKTVFHLFNDLIEKRSDFQINEAIQKNVSDLKLSNLHLLASSIRFIDIQDRISEISDKTEHTITPMEVLKKEIEGIKNNYDYIIIDCPPNLGFITKNGIEISDYFLIPTIPDKLSTYGIPQIIKKIHDLKKIRKLKIQCLGLIITKFNSRTATHFNGIVNLPSNFQKVFKEIKDKNGSCEFNQSSVFETRIPFANATADAVEFRTERKYENFKEKHGVTKSGDNLIYQHIVNATKEFIEKCE